MVKQLSNQSTRSEIFGISRTNPFNPFIGFDFAFLRSFDNWKLKKFRDIKDKEAEKKGTMSAWHLVDGKNLFD